MSIIDQFHKLFLVFKLNDLSPGSIITENLEFVTAEKRKQNGIKEPMPTVIIEALAKKILSLIGDKGDVLHNALKTKEGSQKLPELASHLHKILVHRRSSYSAFGINSDTPLINEAITTLKQCGQISRLTHIELVAKDYFSEMDSQARQNFMRCHLVFHRLQIDLLEQLLPIFQQITLEKLALTEMAKSQMFLPPDWYSESTAKASSQKFLEVGPFAMQGSKIHPEEKVKRFEAAHQKLKQLSKKIAELSPQINKSHVFDLFHRTLQEISDKNLVQEVEKKDFHKILYPSYLALHAWLQRVSLTDQTFKRLEQTGEELLKAVQGSPFAYHTIHAQKLLSTIHFVKLIYMPYSTLNKVDMLNLQDIQYQATCFLAMNQSSLPSVSHAFVAAVKKNDLQKARISVKETLLDLRKKFLYFFSEKKLQKNVSTYAKDQVLHTYTCVYEYARKNILPKTSLKALESCIKPRKFSSRIHTIAQQYKCLSLEASTTLSKIALPDSLPKVFLSKNQKKPIDFLVKTQKSCQSSSSDERLEVDGIHHIVDQLRNLSLEQVSQITEEDEVIENPQEMPLLTRAEKIPYFYRVLRWEKGEEILDIDPSYKGLEKTKRALKVYQHCFPYEVDDYLDLYFSSFFWHTYSGKCILYTAPATLDFQNEHLTGFLEYSFSMTRDNSSQRDRCFHRYFAEKKESLCHRLAEKQHLALSAPVLEDENRGVWQIFGSTIEINDQKEFIAFIDRPNNAVLTIKKPGFV